MQDVEECLMDLSNVVKECHALDDAAIARSYSCRFSEDECIAGNASHMRSGIRIICIDGIEHCLEQCCGEAFGIASNAVLIEQPRSRGKAEGTELCCCAPERHVARESKNYSYCHWHPIGRATSQMADSRRPTSRAPKFRVAHLSGLGA